jgi:predicted SprT family Zn-dependent metalloprotease
MTDAEKMNAIRKRAQAVMAIATSMYQVDLSGTQISFNLKGRVAGYAYGKSVKCSCYRLKFNQFHSTGDHFQDIIDDTIPHEVAHLVTFANRSLGHGHDSGWQRICIALGGNGKRCHDYEIKYAAGGFDYLTDRGHTVTVSKIIHHKVQAGRSYTYKNGKGRINKSRPFCVQGGVMPAPAAVTVEPTKINFMYDTVNGIHSVKPTTSYFPTSVQPASPVRNVQNGSMSKAEQVRVWIREAKRLMSDQSSVMQKAVSELNMTRAQAQRYVSENWVKV